MYGISSCDIGSVFSSASDISSIYSITAIIFSLERGGSFLSESVTLSNSDEIKDGGGGIIFDKKLQCLMWADLKIY